MNHQLFEKWLLEGATLDKAHNILLQEHLKSCRSCNRLACNLTRVEQRLRSTQPIRPRVGFTERFQAGLPNRQAARQRRQIWSMIFSGLSVGVAIYIYQILPEITRLSLSGLISAILNNLLSIVATLLRVGQVSRFVLMGIPPAVPLAVWISLTTAFLVLSLIWVLALGRILAPKGEKA